MGNVWYELLRISRSKTFWGIIAVIIVMSLIPALALNYSAPPPSPTSGIRTDYGYYIDGSSYQIVNFVHNAYGHPVYGVVYYIQVNGNNYSATSDVSGFANITIPISSISGLAQIREFHSEGTSSFPYTIPLNSTKKTYLAGDNFYGVPYIVTGVYNRGNPRLNNLLIYYIGDNGSFSPEIGVYWSAESSNFSSSAITEISGTVANSTLIEDVKGFHSIIITPNIPYMSGVYSQKRVFFITLVNTNTTGIIKSYAVNLVNELPTSDAYEFLFSELGTTLQLFMPLIAIISAYQIYAADRVSGVIKSVLVRPITKSQIMFSRYAAAIVAIGASIVLSAGLLGFFSMLDLGVSIPFNLMMLIIWAFIVETFAFVGIVFLISHLVGSNARLIGSAIVLYLVFNLLWTLLNQIFGDGNTLNYFSPGGYFSLVKFYVFNKLYSTSPVVILHENFNWSWYLGLLFLAGSLWILIPFLSTYVLTKVRD